MSEENLAHSSHKVRKKCPFIRIQKLIGSFSLVEICSEVHV